MFFLQKKVVKLLCKLIPAAFFMLAFAIIVFASVKGLDVHFSPPIQAQENRFNDHYALPTGTNTALYSFSWDFQTADNLPLADGVTPRSPVPIPLVGGTPYSIYVFYCDGTPPVSPAVFTPVGPTWACPAPGGGGYRGSRDTLSGSITLSSPWSLRDASGDKFVLVRFLYHNFANESEIWQQEQLSASRGLVTDPGVRTIVTWNFGSSTQQTDVRQRFGFCGDGRVSGPETCDAGVGGVATATAVCTISCQAPITSGSSGSVCGDGVIGSTETCDDGNTISGDGCSSICQIERTSGTPGTGGGTGTCGTDNGISTSTLPTSLCAAGTASAVTDSGTTWDWTCTGTTSTATCQATHTLISRSTGNACSFVIAQDGDSLASLPATLPGSIPTVAPQRRTNTFGDRWVVPVQLDANADALCFDPALLSVQVRTESINAEYRHNPAAQTWGTPLNLSDPSTPPQYEFDATQGILYLPVQSKQSYEITANVYDPATGTLVLPAPSSSAYFDTRIPHITVIGPSRTHLGGSVGDANLTEVRNVMNPNIARIFQPFEHSASIRRCDATNGVTLTSLDPSTVFYEWSAATGSHSTRRTLSECMSADQRVIYFDPTPSAGPAWVELVGNAANEFKLPNRATTLLLRGADLRLSADLKYPLLGFGGSFGVISLKNNVGGTLYGGNILVNPAPTNIVGAYYIEGSVIAAEAGWRVPTDAGMPSRDNTAWYDTFHNQLYWQGTIISRNTIETSIDPTIWPTATAQSYASTPQCPASDGLSLVACTWPQAVAYDLAHLREFHRCLNPSSLTSYSPSWNISGCTNTSPYIQGTNSEIVDNNNSGAVAAAGLPSRLDNISVIIKYDGRLSSNPPPGFEGVSSLLQTEIGL